MYVLSAGAQNLCLIEKTENNYLRGYIFLCLPPYNLTYG